jgi:hypothetical protein
MKWIWVILIVCFFGVTERDVIRQATWGRRAVAEMFWSTSADGYRGAKEYLPHEVHLPPTPYLLPKASLADLVCEIPCAPDAVKILRWSEEEKTLQVYSPVPAALVLKLYDYPAWQASIDGTRTQHETTYGGQIKLELPPGRHDVKVTFARTPDRTAGIVISLLAAIVLTLFTLITNSRGEDASNSAIERAISS